MDSVWAGSIGLTMALGQEPAVPPVTMAVPTVEAPDEGTPPEPGPKIPSPMPAPANMKPERRRWNGLGSMTLSRIPGQAWRIHDATRPRPPVVVPGPRPDLPPSDAIVLFDGTNLDHWCHRGENDELFESDWYMENDCLVVKPGSGNLYTIDGFGSCQLHLEWMIPVGTHGVGQSRGNSGIKFMERFEVQVLDSFENRTYADGQAGAIYGQYPPMVNAVRGQGEWQSYDIFFTAPIFENEQLVRPAYLTVSLNGVLVQNHRELPARPERGHRPIRRRLGPVHSCCRIMAIQSVIATSGYETFPISFRLFTSFGFGTNCCKFLGGTPWKRVRNER